MLSFSTTVYRLSASHLHLTWKQCCPILSTFRFWSLAFCMLQNQQQKIFIIWSRKPHFRCSPPSKANIRFIFNIEKDPVLVECIWVWVCITEREREMLFFWTTNFKSPIATKWCVHKEFWKYHYINLNKHWGLKNKEGTKLVFLLVQ